jgi:predicted enzyme related to lactoylglutathione lyase
MSQAEQNLRVDYVEFPAVNLEAAERFYTEVFGWHFKHQNADYISFNDGRMRGGFFKSTQPRPGGPVIVLYALDLEETRAKIIVHGGSICRQTFSFPGGRRFHFSDPSRNVLGVWSEE